MPGVNGWTDVRMFYEKTGMAKYISHLDMIRCFSRAMKRAGVPIWYTEGFNPHAFMSFAMPLSLGTESFCETVDFRLTQDVDLSFLAEKINGVLPPDIRVKRISKPVYKPDEISFAEYEIRFYDVSENFYSVAMDLLKSDEIMAEKKVKQGRKKTVKEVNIKEHIKRFSLRNEVFSDVLSESNGYSVTSQKTDAVLNVFLSSGTKANINPSLLINALLKRCDDFEIDFDIVKKQSYIENGEIFR